MLAYMYLSATVKALQGMNQPIPKTIHRGHIPGSKNVEESEFIDPNTNCFLPPEKITKGEAKHLSIGLGHRDTVKAPLIFTVMNKF